MYNVLIVDDEPIVSVTIKSLVEWEKHNIAMAYEAYNGKQALKLLEENTDIDVVITDVSMPIMDGLELIKTIKQRGMTPAIIVLSAYEDYSLVRNAFKLGVRDYILKTEIDGDNLLALLKSVIDKLNREQLTARTTLHSTENGLVNYEQRAKLLEDLLSGASIDSPYSADALRLSRKSLIVAFLQVDDFRLVEKRYANMRLESFADAILNTVKQALSQLMFGEVICLSPNKYAIVLSFPDKQKADIRSAAHQLLYEIKSNLANFMNIHVSIGVSNIGCGFESIHSLYLQAKKNAEFRFLLGRKKIIFPDDIAGVDQHGDTQILEWDSFRNALADSDEKKIVAELEQQLYLIDSLSSSIRVKYVHYLEIIRAVLQSLQDSEEEMAMFDPDINLYQQLLQYRTSREINGWLRRMIDEYIRVQNRKADPAFSLVIAKAIAFTKENFKDENISVRMVSSYLGLSENHFSMLFKKEVGETFIGYLTNLRIEEAKNLMKSTNLKIYEICDRIGYSNVEHFSRSFKKVTGHSPNQYKKRYTIE